MADKTWKTYEEVARYLLNQFAAHIGLDTVEGKQKILGLISGRQIEIDAKGVHAAGQGFVVIECKHYPKDKVSTLHLEGLAFRIMDAGADGGIVVSPLGLQEGAEKIANSQAIVQVQLDADAMDHQYVLRILNNIMVGVQDRPTTTDKATCRVHHADGTIEDRDL